MYVCVFTLHLCVLLVLDVSLSIYCNQSLPSAYYCADLSFDSTLWIAHAKQGNFSFTSLGKCCVCIDICVVVDDFPFSSCLCFAVLD